MKTKLLAWSAALAMCLSGLSATAFATNDETPTDEPFFEDETIPETEPTTAPGDPSFPDNAWLNITQLPDKVSYKIGEPLDLKGMKVQFGYAVAGSYLAENFDDAEVNEHLDILQLDDSDFDSSKTGTYTIRITYDRTGVYDRGNKVAPPQTVSFDVIVTGANYLKGDVNADGIVDDTDITTLQNWLHHEGNLDNWANADMNHDNKVNIVDLALLKKLVKKSYSDL
ncbi:MAG: dockerin type I repeat-containing protein [Oscillospiraceae bacterium]